ncbi:S8 family serine peptidase [candidate division KSB1 bacterium]|nr:S8 family serine peptidase [candidate division KSB1 bacterium]
MRTLQTIFILILFAIGLSFSQAPIPGNWLYDQNENKVDDRIEHMPPTARIGMIIDLVHTPTEDEIRFLGQFGEIKHVLEFLPAVAIQNAEAERAFQIAEDLRVVMVELDEIVYTSLNTSVRSIRARGSSQYSPNTAWEDGFRGDGINIAILDTGVDDGHPSLDDMDDNASTTNDPKFVAGYDATASPPVETNPDDDNTDYWDYNQSKCVKGDIFHGTHVAGIALGTGAGTDNIGVAPEAKLIDVKVMNSCGSGNTSDIIAGIKWCIKNRERAWTNQPAEFHGIDILNMSLSGSKSDGQDAMSRAVNKAVDAGLIVVCAAGNDNLANNIPTPAAADNAIAVGSVNDFDTVTRTDDLISSHTGWGSNRGPRQSDNDLDLMDELKPDVMGYGSAINSADGINPGSNATGWHVIGGTSMAAPHVSGVAALILEAHPQFQPHDVKNVLRATAEHRGTPYNTSIDPDYNVDYGWGIVNAHEAVTTTNVPPDLWISRLPVWWASNDIWLDNNTPKEGVANTIYARIHNTSGTAANNVKVQFQVGTFGIGQPKWLWKKEVSLNVPATGKITASVPWTPDAKVVTKGPGHSCIRVEIIHAPDPNTANNMAQKNLSIQEATGSSAFTFRAWNPLDAPKRIFFGLEKISLPEGWDALVHPNEIFELDYSDSLEMEMEMIVGEAPKNSNTRTSILAVKPMGFTAETGDTGTVFVKGYMKGSTTDFGGIVCSLNVKDSRSRVSLTDAIVVENQLGEVPLRISSEQSLRAVQTVIDFDSNKVVFLEAMLGEEMEGFVLEFDPYMPCCPWSGGETNRSLLVIVHSDEFVLQGDRTVAHLIFQAKGRAGDATPLFISRDPEQSFMITEEQHRLYGDALGFMDGSIRIEPDPTAVEQKVKTPLKYALYQNYPNPFNPTTRIQYELAGLCDVQLNILNLLGQKVRTLVKGQQNPGVHFTIWDGKNDNGEILPSGMYFYQIRAGEFVQTNKMIFIQ